MTDAFKAFFEEISANIIIKAVYSIQEQQESGNIPRFPDSLYSSGYFEQQMVNFEMTVDHDSLKSSEACSVLIIEDEIVKKFIKFIIDNRFPSNKKPSPRYLGIEQHVKDEITVIEENKDVHKEARKLFIKKDEKKEPKSEGKTKSEEKAKLEGNTKLEEKAKTEEKTKSEGKAKLEEKPKTEGKKKAKRNWSIRRVLRWFLPCVGKRL